MVKKIYLGKTNHKGFENAIKIGITGRGVQQRWREIDKSIKGSQEWTILSGRVLLAVKLEKWLKRRYKRYRRIFKGSGKSEWFVMPFIKRVELIFIIQLYRLLSWGFGLIGVVILIRGLL